MVGSAHPTTGCGSQTGNVGVMPRRYGVTFDCKGAMAVLHSSTIL